MKIFKVLLLFLFFQFALVLSSYAKTIDYIVAAVDGEIVTFSEIQKKMVPVIEHYSKLYSGRELEDVLNSARKEVVNSLIEDKILVLNADASNVDVSDEEVENSIEEFKAKFKTSEEFYNELKGQGLTLVDLKEKVKSGIKVRKFMKFIVLKDVRVTEEDIENFYEKNKDSFFVPGQVKISQILINNTANDDAEKKINDIFAKLQSGEDFAALARMYSEGPNASKGGDLGFVYTEELHPLVRKAISDIAIGEYTEPVHTNVGFHIIKLEARKLPQYTPVSEVKGLIREKVYDSKATEAYNKWIKEAKENVDITVFDNSYGQAS